MFKKVKNWLGIEGVKVQLELPESVKKSDEVINGRIIISSQTDQEIDLIEIELLERYERGRGKDKKIESFGLGAIKGDNPFKVKANEPHSMDFALPFKPLNSEMDQYASRNILLRGFVRTAKWISSVNSTYSVYARVKVKGVALDPFSQKPILLT